MVKVVVYLFLAIILISLLRSILGVIGKAFSALIEPGRTAPGQPVHRGELKRDPVCGTYVSADASVQRTVGGQTVYFCSEACREKYYAEA